MGGTARFLAFIQTQAASAVDDLLQKQCPHHISKLPRGFVGHSYGGLLYSTPSARSVHRYGGMTGIMQEVEECCAREIEPLYKLRMLFSYGEYEQSPPHVTDQHVDDRNQRHARRRAMKENVMEVYKRFQEKDGLFS